MACQGPTVAIGLGSLSQPRHLVASGGRATNTCDLVRRFPSTAGCDSTRSTEHPSGIMMRSLETSAGLLRPSLAANSRTCALSVAERSPVDQWTADACAWTKHGTVHKKAIK